MNKREDVSFHGNSTALSWFVKSRSFNQEVCSQVKDLITEAYEGDPLMKDPFLSNPLKLPMPLAIHGKFTPGSAKIADQTVKGYLFHVQFSFRHIGQAYSDTAGYFQDHEGNFIPKASARYDVVTKSEQACFLTTNDEDQFTGLYRVGMYSDFTEE
jgi:hypothetical protein